MIEITVVTQIINNVLTYNYYFDGIPITEYILYNNNDISSKLYFQQ